MVFDPFFCSLLRSIDTSVVSEDVTPTSNIGRSVDGHKVRERRADLLSGFLKLSGGTRVTLVRSLSGTRPGWETINTNDTVNCNLRTIFINR